MNSSIMTFYGNLVEKICSVTGVCRQQMFRSNTEESVDARTILVYILSSRAMSDMEIASLTGLTRQCVNKLKNGFKYRKNKWTLSSNLQQISNELATESF